MDKEIKINSSKELNNKLNEICETITENPNYLKYAREEIKKSILKLDQMGIELYLGGGNQASSKLFVALKPMDAYLPQEIKKIRG